MISFTYLDLAVILLCVGLLAGLFVVITYLHRRIMVLERFKQGLIAHAQSQPPPEPVLINTWMAAYESLPEGSPKWTAYRNRLIQVGALDGQGNKVNNGDQHRK